jgi:hypothetical protein
MDDVAYEERPMAIPIFAAARDVAISPSGWAKLCIAAGLNPRGNEVWFIY